ncbi:outer membrane protein assembly factor BamB family protein [Kribbella monticola]|uniref:outer membrane protein assembly factor BamB family protein n=1 Tax=Kribbella monticola TaxID=2185285 RepID=UPI001300B90E|nr:PQQ-binding-like beta-propeller repeat protein [Kribbella monticola]
MKFQLVARGRAIFLGILALVGLGAVGWAIAVPRPVLYVLGLLLCAPLIVLLAAEIVRRRTSRRLILWSAGLLAAVVVLVVAIAVPRAALDGQSRSGVKWSASLDDRVPMMSGISVWAIGDRIYLLSAEQPLRSYEKSTGRFVASYPAARYEKTAVAADGSVVGWSASAEGGGNLTYYARDGEKLWAKSFKGRGAIGSLGYFTPVVAASEGLVVLADCKFRELSEAKPCTWTGVDKTGKTVWTQQDYRAAENLAGRTRIFRRTVPALPSVVVGLRQVDKERREYVIRSAADGRELNRHLIQPLSALGLQGDLTVIAEKVDDNCQLLGFRDGKQTVATSGMPCLQGMDTEYAGTLQLTPERAYLLEGGNARTVSLKDGSWRSIGGLTISTGDEPAVAGSDEIVYRSGGTLTAVDAGSGDQLWKKDVPGDIVGMYVDNGGLLVFSKPNVHNPFLSHADQDERAIQVTSWVSRTGKQTASLLVRNGNATRGASAGPGQSFLVAYDVPAVRLVGAD